MFLRKNPNIVLRIVPPAAFLVDITRSYNNQDDTLVEINEMGRFIWKSIDGCMPDGTIISKLLDELQDEKTEEFVSMVSADVRQFLSMLVTHGCLEECKDE